MSISMDHYQRNVGAYFLIYIMYSTVHNDIFILKNYFPLYL